MEDLFEYSMKTDEFYLKYAKGKPSATGREFHDYNEFVFFINGDSCFISKDIQQTLSPGNLLIIPGESFHQFVVNCPENYERCILGLYDSENLFRSADEVFSGVKIISKPDEKIFYVFKLLIEIITSSIHGEEKRNFIVSTVEQLLFFCKYCDTDVISKNINLSPVIRHAIEIIDRDYDKDLSVKSIAKLLYVSPSTLSHKFSKELNISVYRYITEKRLSVVRQYIEKGERAYVAAEKSGFSDYSAFFRLYKKRYGKNPTSR